MLNDEQPGRECLLWVESSHAPECDTGHDDDGAVIRSGEGHVTARAILSHANCG
jgi:hypothetical protein